MAHIVNLRHAPALRAALDGKAEHGGTVRIDRRSQWGNRFRIGPDGPRDEVIARYRADLWRRVRAAKVGLDELAALHGKPLACWCAPLPCHGQVLARAAAWAASVLAERRGEWSGRGANAARREREGPGHRQHGRRTEMQSVTSRSIARTSRGSTTMAISPARLRSDSSIRVRCGDGPCRLRAIPSGRALRCNLRSASISASIPIVSARWRSLRAPLAGPAPETRVSIPEPHRASGTVANNIPLDVMAHCPTRARCANPASGGVLLFVPALARKATALRA